MVATVTTGQEGQVDEVCFAPTRTPATHDFLRVIHDGTKGTVQITLPLGSYDVVEVQAPYGYVLGTEYYTVTFAWGGQTQELVLAKRITHHTENGETTTEYDILPATDALRDAQTLVFENARTVSIPDTPEHIGVGVTKRDAANEQPLAGAVYALYTVDALYNSKGECLAEAGALLETSAPTGEDGFTRFASDIPLQGERYAAGITEPEDGAWTAAYNSGRYQVVEVTAPAGYALNTTPLEIEFTYPGQTIPWQLETVTQHNNALAALYIRKTDVGGQDLPGAELLVREQNGDVVDRWQTDGTAHKLTVTTDDTPGQLTPSDAEQEHVYTLLETAAPAGYQIATSIDFKVELAEDETLRVFVRDAADAPWTLVDGKTLTMVDQAVPTPAPTPEPTPAPTPQPPTPHIPQTGDDFPALALFLFMLGSAALAGVLLVARHMSRQDYVEDIEELQDE